MSQTVAIDSINFRTTDLESLIVPSRNYIQKNIRPPNRREDLLEWRRAFGAPLTSNIRRASIIYTHRGSRLALISYSRNIDQQTLIFAGLHGYNDYSQQLRATLVELSPLLCDVSVSRLDVCIDFPRDKIHDSIIRELSKRRTPLQVKGTTYFKTDSEKKTNGSFDIKIYDKQKHAGLSSPLTRLEFCFKPAFLRGVKYRDLSTIFPRIESTINRFSGLSIKVNNSLLLSMGVCFESYP